MKKFRAWVSAARLRTLPLSLSGVITGTAIANFAGFKDDIIFSLCLFVTVLYQITSNFANDYGDGVKGTDANDRIGPSRALQSGLLTAMELKRGISVTAILSLVLTLVLLTYSFGYGQLPYLLIFVFLGVASIWAAIRYTVGESAYGYKGLGDIFVFFFFGILAVLGTKFLYVPELNFMDFLPAIGIGLLCVGVLNLNNLRDVVSDGNHGKRTLIVLMGFRNGKIYHAALLSIGFLVLFAYAMLQFKSWHVRYFLLVFIFIFFHVLKVMRTKKPKDLDPELKKLALSTFILSILFYLSINYFL